MGSEADARHPHPLQQLDLEGQAVCGNFDNADEIKVGVWDQAVFMGLALALLDPEWANLAIKEFETQQRSPLGDPRGVRYEAFVYARTIIDQSYSVE